MRKKKGIKQLLEQLVKIWVIVIPSLTIAITILGLLLCIIFKTTLLFWLVLPLGFIIWITGLFIIEWLMNIFIIK